MIKLKVATPEKKIYDQEVEKVTVKTITGEITILPRHIPLLSAISNGYVILDGEKVEITSGTLVVKSNSTVEILISE